MELIHKKLNAKAIKQRVRLPSMSQPSFLSTFRQVKTNQPNKKAPVAHRASAITWGRYSIFLETIGIPKTFLRNLNEPGM